MKSKARCWIHHVGWRPASGIHGFDLVNCLRSGAVPLGRVNRQLILEELISRLRREFGVEHLGSLAHGPNLEKNNIPWFFGS